MFSIQLLSVSCVLQLTASQPLIFDNPNSPISNFATIGRVGEKLDPLLLTRVRQIRESLSSFNDSQVDLIDQLAGTSSFFQKPQNVTVASRVGSFSFSDSRTLVASDNQTPPVSLSDELAAKFVRLNSKKVDVASNKTSPPVSIKDAINKSHKQGIKFQGRAGGIQTLPDGSVMPKIGSKLHQLVENPGKAELVSSLINRLTTEDPNAPLADPSQNPKTYLGYAGNEEFLNYAQAHKANAAQSMTYRPNRPVQKSQTAKAKHSQYDYESNNDADPTIGKNYAKAQSAPNYQYDYNNQYADAPANGASQPRDAQTFQYDYNNNYQ